MLDYRSTIVALGVLVGTLHVGCGDPDLPTDLRTSGPPNITTVTVMSDLENDADPDSTRTGLGRILEDATYCRIGDDKRPGLVGLPDIRVIQICPDDLQMGAMDDGKAEAVPPAWFVRVVFDQLLDPSIEDLVPVLDDKGMETGQMGTLENTQPVTLKCNGVDVAYGGDYVPNGNKQSWPLGPALFITPIAATDVPTGATCTVSVKDKVQNKHHQSAPTDHRDFTFQIAAMSFRFSDPDPGDKNDGSILLSPTSPVQLFWTAELQAGATVMSTDSKGMETMILSQLDTTKIHISSAPNLPDPSDPDGKADPAVCDGSAGTPVDPATIRAYLAGPGAVDTALVLRIDVGNDPTSPAQLDKLWEPNTTYRLTFDDGTMVSPKQGGDPGALPGATDFSLCFHTSSLPTP